MLAWLRCAWHWYVCVSHSLLGPRCACAWAGWYAVSGVVLGRALATESALYAAHRMNLLVSGR